MTRPNVSEDQLPPLDVTKEDMAWADEEVPSCRDESYHWSHRDHLAQLACRERQLLVARRQLQQLRVELRDSTTVHVRILRGEIALTTEQAWHIAGGDQRTEQLRQENERLKAQVEELRQEIRDTARDAAAEANWKNVQGEDYGSY